MSRSSLIKFVTFLGGIYFFLEFFIPAEIGGYQFNKYHTQITTSLRIMGAMAIGLGVINIFQIHTKKIFLLSRGWINSFALMFGLFAMLIITANDWKQNLERTEPAKQMAMLSSFANKLAENQEFNKKSLITEEINWYEASLGNVAPEEEVQAVILFDKLASDKLEIQTLLASPDTDVSQLELLGKKLGSYAGNLQQFITLEHQNSNAYLASKFLFDSLFVALGSAMFSLLAFYVASAAYRSFRIKTLESALMMLAALIVMLGQIPFGIWLWDGFPEVRFWLLTVPSSAAFRAITIGSGVAGLIIALRMWLSIETDYTKKKN